MFGFVGRVGCQRAWILIQYPIQRVLDSLGFSKFERSLFSVWTGVAPVWSVARPLHSGGCFGAEASPDRPLLTACSSIHGFMCLPILIEARPEFPRCFSRNWSV